MTDSAEAVSGEFWADANGEQALQRYRTLVQAIDDGIVQLDAEGRVIAVNNAFLELTGFDRDDLLMEHVSIAIDEEDRRRIEGNVIGRSGTDGQHETFELAVHTGNGGTVPCEFRMNPLVDDGELQGAVGILRDCSERKSAVDSTERRDLARELRERERQLSRLLDNVPGMVYHCRNERGWPMEFVSDACQDISGYASEALERGDVVWGEDVMVEADRDEVWKTVQQETNEGETFSATYRIETADGETRWVRDHGRGVFDDDELVEIEGIIFDITDRKRTRQQLQEERDIFAEGPAIVFRWKPDEGEGWPVEYVSENVEDVFGYTPEEFESGEVPYADLLLDEEIDRIATEVEENSERTTKRFSHEPYRVKTKDGDVRWVKDTTKIIRDDDDNITNYLGYLVDITERKEREQELRRYETIVEAVEDGVYIVDDDGHFTMVNDAYAEMVGYDREELIGEHVSLVVDEEVVERAQQIEAAMRDDAADSPAVEAELKTASGDRLPTEATFALLSTEDGTERRVGVVRNLTERKQRERKLRETTAQLEAAVEAGAVGTWEWHVPEDRMVAGPSFARLFGVDPETAREGVSMDRFLSAIHEDDRDRVERKIEAALESCGEYEAEYRVRIADDEIRWVVSRGRVECDEDGHPDTFPGAITDITERKLAERQLQRNKEQLEALFEVLPVGVVVAEADGEIVSANDTAEEIWAGDVFDADSVEEYERYPVFRADTGERVQPEEMTMARVVDGEEVTEPDVYEIEAADGERRIVELEGRPIWNDAGEVVRGVVTMSDVTERRMTQRKLKESERRYRTLVEYFPEGAVALFDENLEYTAMGGQLVDELGVGMEERVGNSVYEIYPDDLVEEIEPYFEAALDGETNTFEVEFHGRHLYAYTLPVRNADDEVFAGMLVVQDVTERREYERRLEESNERLEQFAYAASHDLQEPLRMISSYLQLLERRYEDALDGDGEQFLEFAVDGADRMREMIEGLLQYSRVETQGDPLEPIDLDDVFEDVLADLQVQIAENNAEITAQDLPRVEGDTSQLRQVFQNVLENAITYSGDEPPRVHVTAERTGLRWVVSVRDEGIGIDPDDQDRIFEVFQRLHTHGEHDGTGIGLALCERIVERHGGEIWVDSEPGEGTTFSFTLPAAVDRQ